MKAFEMANGDINPSVLVEGVEAVRANLQARLSIVRGECMFNTQLGLPLGATKEELDLSVQKIIIQTDGIVGISEFSSVIANKVYKCRFKADTVYGGLLYE